MITITANVDEFRKALRIAAQDQLPFAVSKAINRAAVSVQDAQRKQIRQSYTLRRETFILNTVKIDRGNFATKRKLEAIVGMDNRDRRGVLLKFEEGGEKTPTQGGKSLVIPIDAKRNKNDIITRGNRPRAFGFTQSRSSTNSRVSIYLGQRRTFMIQYPDGRGWILRRTGKGQSGSVFTGTTVLYTLQRKAPIPKSLRFRETATRVVTAKLSTFVIEELNAALRTAR